MYLRDLAIHADEQIVDRFCDGFVRKFHRDTCCVTELYLSLIDRKVKTPDTAKVGLTFTDLVDGPPEHLAGRCFYEWPFDFTSYVEADVPVKKRMILDALQEALLWIASKEGWKRQPFDDAYKQAVSGGLVFDGISKQSWVSPCGKYRVRVYMNFDLDGVDFWAVLFRNRSSKELAREFLGKGIPEMDCLRAYTSNGRWRSKTVFEIRASTFIREKWAAEFGSVIKHGKGG